MSSRRSGWAKYPTFGIGSNAVIYGIIYLFYEPNPDDPLNHEAADLLRSDKGSFERQVKRSLQGGTVQGEQFDRLI